MKDAIDFAKWVFKEGWFYSIEKRGWWKENQSDLFSYYTDLQLWQMFKRNTKS